MSVEATPSLNPETSSLRTVYRDFTQSISYRRSLLSFACCEIGLFLFPAILLIELAIRAPATRFISIGLNLDLFQLPTLNSLRRSAPSESIILRVFGSRCFLIFNPPVPSFKTPPPQTIPAAPCPVLFRRFKSRTPPHSLSLFSYFSAAVQRKPETPDFSLLATPLLP